MDKTQTFVIWLDGFLDASNDSIGKTQTNTIKEKLNGLFEHVVEPSADVPTISAPPSFIDYPQDPDGPTIYRC